jgi:hypothetical protein
VKDQSDGLQQIVCNEKLRLEGNVLEHAFRADVHDNIYVFLTSQIFGWTWAKTAATARGFIETSLSLINVLNFALKTVDSDIINLTSLQFYKLVADLNIDVVGQLFDIVPHIILLIILNG